MKNSDKKPAQEPIALQKQILTAESIGLDPLLYASALRYLFDRPVPGAGEQEWYWDIDEAEFVATPLEWTRIQTVLFANAGSDLQAHDDEHVGMGLNYILMAWCKLFHKLDSHFVNLFTSELFALCG